jgi:hypothetical protein
MNDLKRQAFEQRKKTKLMSYFLWLFLGALGGHRWYLKRWFSAGIIMLLSLIDVYFQLKHPKDDAGSLFFGGLVMIWLIIDIFLIPGMVKRANTDIALDLGIDSIEEKDENTQKMHANFPEADAESNILFDKFSKDTKTIIEQMLLLVETEDLSIEDIKENIDQIIINDDRLRQSFANIVDYKLKNNDMQQFLDDKILNSMEKLIDTMSVTLIALMVFAGRDKAADKKLVNVSVDKIKDIIGDNENVENFLLAYMESAMELHNIIVKYKHNEGDKI